MTPKKIALLIGLLAVPAIVLLLVFALDDLRWQDHMDTAEAAYEQGSQAEAEAEYRAAIEVAEGFREPDARLAESLERLGQVYDDGGRYAEAEPLLLSALAIRETAQGPDHADTAATLDRLARLYDELGKYQAGIPYAERAVAIFERLYGPDHAEVASKLHTLAWLECQLGRYREAEPLYQRALAIQEKTLGPDDPSTGAIVSGLGLVSFRLGRLADAEPHF